MEPTQVHRSRAGGGFRPGSDSGPEPQRDARRPPGTAGSGAAAGRPGRDHFVGLDGMETTCRQRTGRSCPAPTWEGPRSNGASGSRGGVRGGGPGAGRGPVTRRGGSVCGTVTGPTRGSGSSAPCRTHAGPCSGPAGALGDAGNPRTLGEGLAWPPGRDRHVRRLWPPQRPASPCAASDVRRDGY